jgi:photosystem II stability/assembly factor-like uncharacterized protein
VAPKGFDFMSHSRLIFRFILALLVLAVTAAAAGAPTMRPHNWTFLGPAPVFDGSTRFSGRIDVAVPDPLNPNVMYAGAGAGGGTAGGGIWMTSNWLSGNPVWQPLTDRLPSLSIFSKSLTLFPSPRGAILYAAAQGPNGGIMRSTDGGRHWKYLAQNIFNGSLFGAIVVSPADSGTVYVAAGGNGTHGLYKSIDAGVNWSNVTNSSIGLGNATDVVIDPNNPSVLYTGIINGSAPGATNGGIYKSTDAGQSWAPMTLALPAGFAIGDFIALRMAPSNSNYVYATVFGSQNATKNPQLQRLRTIDGGASWQLLTLPNAKVPSMCGTTPNNMQDYRYWHVVLAVDPGNPDVVYANACEPTFVVSQDGGSSWTELPTVDDVVNVFFDDSGNLVLVGDRGIHLSSNPLSMNPTFTSMQGNLGNFLIHTLALDALNLSMVDAVVQDQLSGLQYSGSTTWNYLSAGYEVGRFLINPANDNLAYTWGFDGKAIFLKRSENGGQTWMAEMFGLNIGDFEAEDTQTPYNAFVLAPDNPALLVLGGQHVWEALDQGPSQPLNWSMLPAAPSAGNQITAIAVAPGTNAQTIYAGTEGNRFFSTTNAGASWNNISPQPSITDAITTAIVIDPQNPQRLFINTAAASAESWDLNGTTPTVPGRMWMTINGGASWSNIDGNLPANLAVHTLAADFNFHTPALFAGTDRGVFWSRNLGGNWTILKNGLPNVMIDDMAFLPHSGVLAAGTFGRGVWETVIPGGGAAGR